MTILTAIGLMSGTSLDGIDVALVETDGEKIGRLGPTGYRSYAEAERMILRQALADAAKMQTRDERPGVLVQAEKLVTEAHAEAVTAFIAKNGIQPGLISAVGFHGQTVLHRPQARLTVQIGDGAKLARQLRIPVVYDFRAADVVAGGEGAPLVPVFHRALARSLDLGSPLAIVNIGGVANITYLDGEAEPIAFDTGPGNAPIDDLMRLRTGKTHDADGKLAARGKVDEKIVEKTLDDPFFSRKPPKSLDRATFAKFPLESLSDEDAAATATAIIAASIAKSFDYLPKKPVALIVAGGGAQNPTLMAMLRARTSISVKTANEVGWRADAIEAQAFAYLAVRVLKGLPLTFPTTTGVRQPMTGGVITRPE